MTGESTEPLDGPRLGERELVVFTFLPSVSLDT